MCREFLTGGYEGETMSRMLVCQRLGKKARGKAGYDVEDFRVLEEIGQRYSEQGWLERDDEKRLEELWRKLGKNRRRTHSRSAR